MVKALAESASAGIRQMIDGATSKKDGIPGAVFIAVDKSGKPMFSHASGTRGLEVKEPMSMDSIFWIASCTKIIGATAVMQLVEQGKVSLDDGDALEKICPEFKDLKILKNVDANGKADWAEKSKKITLRMLLTHTAGFGYSFFNDRIRRYNYPAGVDEFSGLEADILGSPLLFEPGTAWQYGVNIDWAGTVVERVSGMKLNDYFQKNIFEPLGLKNINMFPTDSMKANLAHMHQKEQNGTIRGRDHILRAGLVATGAAKDDVYNSAGGGCFAKPAEYCEFLSVFLNDGVSPVTGKRLLKKETVDEMFTNQIPTMPNYGRQDIPAAKPDQTNAIPDIYPQGDAPQGWGISGMLRGSPSLTGSGANTMHWAGLANLFWWCDRERGVAGMIATQILPFASKSNRCLCSSL